MNYDWMMDHREPLLTLCIGVIVILAACIAISFYIRSRP